MRLGNARHQKPGQPGLAALWQASDPHAGTGKHRAAATASISFVIAGPSISTGATIERALARRTSIVADAATDAAGRTICIGPRQLLSARQPGRHRLNDFRAWERGCFPRRFPCGCDFPGCFPSFCLLPERCGDSMPVGQSTLKLAWRYTFTQGLQDRECGLSRMRTGTRRLRSPESART